MTKDELISKQQLEIEYLKECLHNYRQSLENIRGLIVCIGGPLNDNFYKYTKDQLFLFRKILAEIGL